ncbi:MAG TPA: choice-of-anchor Q domain-containing protein, partial [Vicinamibacterales bacterium]|nr:choice-of-anchor Q domain-containing protein [Vicinamibacterales bacterium]
GKADAALSAGGGVYCNGGGAACSPRLSNLVFSGNLAVFGGGALYNGGSGGSSSPTITNSTFSGNAAANGGAIYDDGSEGGTSNPSIANATFSNNSASSCGGAIYDDASGFGTSSPIIRSATFSGNSADSGNGDGSAICDFTATGINATALTNAIVWSNTSPEISTYSGGMTLDHVVLQENACPVGAACSTAPIGTDPHLGPLQDNGGSTPTHMIGAGSSAINAGLDSACVGAPVNALDQRGIARPLGAPCDIGAVEATQLNLNVTDGVAFGFYGKTLQYVVTLQNLSATDTISGVHVSGLGTAALDGPNTLWFCTVGNCTTTQKQGSLSDVATLVPNGTLTWLVNVPVIADSTAATATMTIHSSGAGAASDTDTLAIFRGTFEGP